MVIPVPMEQDEVGLLKSYGINIRVLHERVDNYSAGNIRHYYQRWKKLTSYRHILGIVQDGLMLNFLGDPPEKGSFEYPRSQKEFDLIDAEVRSLLKKGVVSKSTVEDGDYFSNLFAK